MAFQLSKSRYLRGFQCHKSLWLQTHQPELRDGPDASALARLQGGNEVGDLARDLFPNGRLIPYEGHSLEEQLRLTAEALKSGKVLYEAAFSHNGVFVKADILRKGRKGWELYEVKASTKLEDIHLDDVAVQCHVLTGSGIPISNAFVVCLNTNYVRKGALDIDALFTKHDVTAEVMERQAEVKKEIARQKRMLKGDMPAIDIGSYCNGPSPCDFSGHCWQHIPDDSVFDLAGKGIDKFAAYRSGIIRQQDIPLEMLKGKQRQQVEALKGKKTIVDRNKLKAFLDTLWYPLCFLDFETFQSAIPPYDGLRPYQQVPFQYSLHFQKRAGGKLYHREYLAEPGVDPRKELLERLLEDIPDGACILVYFKPFEEGRLKELAERFPRKRKNIKALLDNMIDLLVPFEKRYIYSWKQKGSHSIKAVLPAFVKGMSYEGMEIANGMMAMEAYHLLGKLADKPQELTQLQQNLLDYCCQDTLSMVKLFELLCEK